MSDQLSLLQKHFDTALESPDGIKKLRELILTLAMQGKLVKQDHRDQPASELLKEIQAEKERLIREGKIKPISIGSIRATDKAPCKLPESWTWELLPNVAYFQEGPGIMAKDFSDTGIPLIRIAGMKKDFVTLDGCNFLNPDLVREKWEHFKLNLGDIVLTSSASLGNVAKVNQNSVGCIIYTGLIRFKYFCTDSDKYLIWFFRSPAFIRQINESKTGAAIQHFGPTHLKKMLFPLPPLAEQKRIVAKIDELMALCDKLEAQRKARNDKRLAVHTAAIDRLLSAADTNDFDSAWQFITRHFDPLYSVKENVAELKNAILTLAMQGKLVKQDSKDQPASELLKEIQAEKERLVKEGKIKRQKELPPIKPEEIPYQVPEGWVWTRLGEISSVQTGKKDVNEGHENGSYPFFSCAQIPLKSNEYSYDKEALLLPGNGANVGQVTYYHGRFEAYQRTYILSDFFPDTIAFIQKTLEARFLKSLEGKQYGSAINYIKLGSLTDFLVPLPPLAEQKRIVAKIDELMTLCEKLENQIDQATAKQTALFNAVLAKV